MADENLFRKALDYSKRVVTAYKQTQKEKRRPLSERYSGIIQRTREGMTLSPTRRHYVDDLTIQCVREIALNEGRQDVAPHPGEWLSKWRLKALPAEYVVLTEYLEELFQRHYSRLKYEQQREEELSKERRFSGYEEWLSANKALVGKFLEIADRKVSTLDDYGDENWDVLPKEINTFLLKIAKSEGDNGMTEKQLKEAQKESYFWDIPEKYVWLKSRLESEFRRFHAERLSRSNVPEFSKLSGIDFENYLARVLKQMGFIDVRGTAIVGDQGGDLIARNTTKTVVIQAKRYQGSVGNRAVQEVVAAVKFYNADEGWVITSGTFTASAKALAQANGVKLIDGYALRSGSFVAE